MEEEPASTDDGARAESLAEALDVLAARGLAARGETDAAEALLGQRLDQPASIGALDLLARIAVQKGRFERARTLWKDVLAKEPTNEAAKAALARLDSPWLALALIRRTGWLAGIAITISLALVGVFALFKGPSTVPVQRAVGSESTKRVEPAGPAVAAIAVGAVVETPTPVDAKGVPVSVAKEEVQPMAPPVFEVPKCSAHVEQGETRFVFDEGLFSYRCELASDAQERLAGLGAALKENASNCWIVVEGHTDADPIPGNSVYRDNYALGLHRALAAAEVLRTNCGIPPAVVSVTSAGDQDPPFPGMDYEAKRKNRTVVIRVVRSPLAERDAPASWQSGGENPGGTDEFAR